MKKAFKIILISCSIFLVACQQTVDGPERPLNTSDQNRTNARTVKRASTIVPTLSVEQNGETTEYRLESQTARYLNDKQSELEILLGDNIKVTCEDNEPLEADDNILKINVKSENDEAISPESPIVTTAILQTGDDESEINVEQITISNVNDSIIRGDLILSNQEQSFSGEFFTAICRE
ncbi:hypothetical protein GF376_01830 [Candidatus Peregrinibacteria bacterium]|nr:hypothetical protein [Candidatus Peregrinibacteria bacterium]